MFEQVVTGSGDALIGEISEWPRNPGGDAAEDPPAPTNLCEHEANGIRPLENRTVESEDNNAVGEFCDGAILEFSAKCLALQRCESEATPFGITSQRKQHGAVTQAAVPIIEDQRVSALHRAILFVVVFAVVLLIGSGDTEAGAEETEKSPVELTEADDTTHGPHHRIDLGLERFGGTERSILTLALGYTWAPGMQHSLHVNANLLDSSLGESDGDGLSDTLIQYSWAPTEKITARPWLPRRFGTGLGLVVPTGDFEQGTGSDMWVAAPFLGLPITIGESLILLPSLLYLHSFSHGENAIPLQALIGEFGVLYGFAEKWWVTFIPAAAQDFEFSETTWAASLQVGREIGSKHGISLEVGGSDDEFTSILAGFASDFNWRVTLKGHLGFH